MVSLKKQQHLTMEATKIAIFVAFAKVIDFRLHPWKLFGLLAWMGWAWGCWSR
jgi:hypothetical protein